MFGVWLIGIIFNKINFNWDNIKLFEIIYIIYIYIYIYNDAVTQSGSSAIWGNGNTTCRELARSKFNIYSNNNSRLFISWKINIQIIVFKNFNVRSFLKFYFRDTIDRSPSILSIDILTHSFHRFETTIVEKLICHSIITLDRFQNPKNPNIFFSPYISYPFERDHEVIQPPSGRNT